METQENDFATQQEVSPEPRSFLASALLGVDEDSSDDEDYQPEKKKGKKNRVVTDEDDEDEGEDKSPQKQQQQQQPQDVASTKESSDSESSSSDSEDSEDEEETKQRRAPSIRNDNKKRSKFEQDNKNNEKQAQSNQKPQNAFDQVMTELKKTRGKKKTELSQEQKSNLVEHTLLMMSRAYAMDNHNRRNKIPATEKLSHLDEVMKNITNQQLLTTFVDRDIANDLVNWLRPSKKSLPNITLRTKLFQAIDRMPFQEDEDAIKTSKIGKILNFYRCHPDETIENKRLCNSIITRWMDHMTKRSS